MESIKSIIDLKTELTENQFSFMEHYFRQSHQFSTLKLVRSNLKEGDIFILQDFSQNYTCKYAREVQSHFYCASKQEVVLHTGVVYLPKGDMQSLCTVSKSLRHDPPAIMTHLIPVLDLVLTEGITRIHFQSDSPVTQYRNKAMFFLVCDFLPKLYPQIIVLFITIVRLAMARVVLMELVAVGKIFWIRLLKLAKMSILLKMLSQF